MTEVTDADEQLDPLWAMHRYAPVPTRPWRPTPRRCTTWRLPSVGPLILSEIDALRARSTRERSPLEVRVLELGPMVVVGLEGVLDETTTPTLRRRLRAVRPHEARVVVFDCSLLQSLSDDGARTVVEVDREVRRTCGRVAIRQPSESARAVLRRSGLPDDIEFED